MTDWSTLIYMFLSAGITFEESKHDLLIRCNGDKDHVHFDFNPDGALESITVHPVTGSIIR